MKVLVMGGGVIGVTPAWQLLKDGHEVTLVERLREAAEETSFANAGAIAPGPAYACSSPKAKPPRSSSVAAAILQLIATIAPELTREVKSAVLTGLARGPCGTAARR